MPHARVKINHIELQVARIRAELTKRETAEAAGVSYSAYVSYERGNRSTVAYSTIEDLALVLGVEECTIVSP